jgi:hypothetical protein
MGDMPGLGLQEEEEVSIFLRFLVVGEKPFLEVGGIFEVIRHFVLLPRALTQLSRLAGGTTSHLFQRHPVLDQQRNPRIQIPHIFLQHEILFRLARNLGFVIALNVLGYAVVSCRPSSGPDAPFSPRARSSSISRSFSLADMDRYSAVEYLRDCRTDRPSCDETVFWRETGMNEEEEDVDARETGGITITDMMLRAPDHEAYVDEVRSERQSRRTRSALSLVGVLPYSRELQSVRPMSFVLFGFLLSPASPSARCGQSNGPRCTASGSILEGGGLFFRFNSMRHSMYLMK